MSRIGLCSSQSFKCVSHEGTRSLLIPFNYHLTPSLHYFTHCLSLYQSVLLLLPVSLGLFLLICDRAVSSCRVTPSTISNSLCRCTCLLMLLGTLITGSVWASLPWKMRAGDSSCLSPQFIHQFTSVQLTSLSSSFLKTLYGAVPALPYDYYHMALVN